MAQVSTAPVQDEGFGATARHDNWWLGPTATVVGLLAFIIYGTWAAWQGNGYEIREIRGADTFHRPGNKPVAPYLSPFYAPLIYDPNGESPHTWIKGDIRPGWIPNWAPFSAGFLILAFPGIFRFTCYYYRKAYYRAFVADPFACAVGEPWKGYRGENHLPMILQNAHRYTMYIALLFLLLLGYDALLAFWWPTDRAGNVVTGGQFGVGLGTLIMVVNVILLTGFTLGCNSVRHLVGGRMDCFSCPHNAGKLKTGYRLWRLSTFFNERHMEWAWLSLFSVGFTDVYIRLCSMGILSDLRII
jgi:hypothetical protein